VPESSGTVSSIKTGFNARNSFDVGVHSKPFGVCLRLRASGATCSFLTCSHDAVEQAATHSVALHQSCHFPSILHRGLKAWPTLRAWLGASSTGQCSTLPPLRMFRFQGQAQEGANRRGSSLLGLLRGCTDFAAAQSKATLPPVVTPSACRMT